MKRKLLLNSILVLALLLPLVPTAMASGTWYVNKAAGSDSNNCQSALTACKTIGHAISLAASGDTIQVAAGTYFENLTITTNLTISGAGAAKTIIDGGGLARVISILNTGAVVTLSNVKVRHGVAAGGGGILSWGTLTINDSTISGNTAASSYSATGGGIYNSGTLTLNNSTLSGNSGSTNFIYGGAIYNSGSLTLNNSTLSGNSASGFTGGGGGGIYNASVVMINNSTLSGNSGSPSGGGIYNGGTATIQNSIIANSSSGGNCSGTLTSNGYNLSSDGSCSFSNTGDLNNTNPRLGPLKNNGGATQTQALLTGSPAIDAGNPNGCKDSNGNLFFTDQRGDARPDSEDAGVGCDMGAFELQNAP